MGMMGAWCGWWVSTSPAFPACLPTWLGTLAPVSSPTGLTAPAISPIIALISPGLSALSPAAGLSAVHPRAGLGMPGGELPCLFNDLGASGLDTICLHSWDPIILAIENARLLLAVVVSVSWRPGLVTGLLAGLVTGLSSPEVLMANVVKSLPAVK